MRVVRRTRGRVERRMVCAACERVERARVGARSLVTSRPISRRDLALGTASESLVERRRLGENVALASKRRGPYGDAIGRTACEGCGRALHDGRRWCNGCAYAGGVCARCGVKIMDVSAYNGHEDVAARGGSKRDASASVKDRRDVSTGDLEREEEEGRVTDGAKGTGRAAAAASGTKTAKTAASGTKAAKTAVVSEDATNARATVAAPAPLAGPTSAADVAREMGQAAGGGPVSNWRLDKTTGYYYDVAAQVYYDSKTGGYFDCKSQTWTMPEKLTVSELQKGVRTGSFKDGTRKPDRFGL